MRSDSVKNMSAYADQNHAPSLAEARLEFTGKNAAKMPGSAIAIFTKVKIKIKKCPKIGRNIWLY